MRGYTRTVVNGHVTYHMTLNAGQINRFAQNIKAIAEGSAASMDIRNATAEIVAQEVADRANDIIVKHGANRSLDGNRVGKVYVYKSSGGLSGVRMPSIKKSDRDAQYPDSYYVEYGFGRPGLTGDGIKALRAKGKRGGDNMYYPRGTEAGVASVGTRDALTRYEKDGKKVYSYGWWYKDAYTHRRNISRGQQGIAPMYNARIATVAELRSPSSDLRGRIKRTIVQLLAEKV